MKTLLLQDAFGLEHLTFVERPRPHLGPHDVLLKMRAASLNYRDLLVIQGLYNPRQPLPFVPFSDGVGEVVEIGSNVQRVRVGDRVCPAFFQSWTAGPPSKERLRGSLGSPLDGVLSEYVALHEDGAVHAPTHLTDAQAATLPCAALTAWSALVSQGHLKSGDTVLIQGTGGVSIFALQFAKLLGATAIVTSSSDEKLERARSLGADVTINYKTDPNWGKTARDATPNRRGVDLVVEVGGAGTLDASLNAVRVGGTIALIGVLSGVKTSLQLTSVLMRNIRIQGIIVGNRDQFEEMNRAITSARLEPVVHTTFPIDQVTDALRTMQNAKHFGKIALLFP